jgi:Recombination endonuclease VII
MRSRRDWAKTRSHRPFPDEDKPARKRRPGEIARFLANDRRRVRRALEPDYRDGERARRYGLTLAQYRALQARQGNACAICRRVTRVLCIDHCHVTGRVRGLLCPKCNSALGFCGDDPRLLRAALAYLLASVKK